MVPEAAYAMLACARIGAVHRHISFPSSPCFSPSEIISHNSTAWSSLDSALNPFATESTMPVPRHSLIAVCTKIYLRPSTMQLCYLCYLHLGAFASLSLSLSLCVCISAWLCMWYYLGEPTLLHRSSSLRTRAFVVAAPSTLSGQLTTH
jgi:hypothetical protein